MGDVHCTVHATCISFKTIPTKYSVDLVYMPERTEDMYHAHKNCPESIKKVV